MKYAGIVISGGVAPGLSLTRFLTLYHHQKTEHQWRFPGGKIEPGETALQAACREAVEEIGVELQSVRYLKEFSSYIDGGDWIGYYFLGEQWKGTPRIMEPDKASHMRWMTYQELVDVDAYPEHQVIAKLLESRLTSKTTYGELVAR